jgi:L-threonylcarbamoyladenylate synthase
MNVLSSLDDPKLVALLKQGAVGVLPTDTIYGLAALASSHQAVERLSEVKQAANDYRPGTVIAADVEQLLALGVDELAVRKVVHLWPNPLSIELPISDKLAYLYQNGPHRAFRVVANPNLRALLQQTGPLLTTSANLHGQPQANSVVEAQRIFGDRVDFYVEGGDLSNQPPSTVAIMKDGKLQVVRQGAVTIDDKGNIV